MFAPSYMYLQTEDGSLPLRAHGSQSVSYWHLPGASPAGLRVTWGTGEIRGTGQPLQEPSLPWPQGGRLPRITLRTCAVSLGGGRAAVAVRKICLRVPGAPPGGGSAPGFVLIPRSWMGFTALPVMSQVRGGDLGRVIGWPFTFGLGEVIQCHRTPKRCPEIACYRGQF